MVGSSRTCAPSIRSLLLNALACFQIGSNRKYAHLARALRICANCSAARFGWWVVRERARRAFGAYYSTRSPVFRSDPIVNMRILHELCEFAQIVRRLDSDGG